MSAKYLTLSKKMFTTLEDIKLRGASRWYPIKDGRTLRGLVNRGVILRAYWDTPGKFWMCRFTPGGYEFTKQIKKFPKITKMYLYPRK